MNVFFQPLKKFTLLELSILLCFLLPPVGLLILLIIGLHTIYSQWIIKKRFTFTLFSYFFLSLFIATVGATISMKEISYIGISVMILGYWGLYSRILETEKNKLFKHYRMIIIFGGCYSCVIGWISKLITFPLVLSYLTGTVLFGEDTRKDYDRLIGCEYNPNFTVYILLIATSFLFSNLLTNLQNKQFVKSMWQISLILVLSFGVIQTGSRAGFASMVLIYFLFIYRLNRDVFFISTIIGISLSKWLLHVMPRSESVIQASEIRQEIWKKAISIWQDHPFFGVTPIGFGQEYLKHYNEYVPHAHNVFIGIFVEYGTLGGLAFLCVIIINLVKFIQLFFSIRNKKSLLNNYLLSLPIILLTGVFDEPLFSPQIGFLTVILLACWDKYTKRIQLVEFPSLSRINHWIYLHILAPKDQS